MGQLRSFNLFNACKDNVYGYGGQRINGSKKTVRVLFFINRKPARKNDRRHETGDGRQERGTGDRRREIGDRRGGQGTE